MLYIILCFFRREEPFLPYKTLNSTENPFDMAIFFILDGNIENRKYVGNGLLEKPIKR